jgi:hypothetical protein
MRCVSITETHKMFFVEVIVIYYRKKYKTKCSIFRMQQQV